MRRAYSEGMAGKASEAEITDTPVLTRTDRRKRQTRDSILTAADQVFREKGIDNATVRDVTDAADVAYGSFYNHFKTFDDVVAAVAERSLKGVADRTGQIVALADRIEMLPAIGARVVMRVLTQDPAVRWLLDRPFIFVEEFYKMATPFMFDAEREAVADGRFKPAGGHDCWLRTYPWILISELKAALESRNTFAHEEQFALISLRFLGIDDALVPELLERSNELARKCGLPEPELG